MRDINRIDKILILIEIFWKKYPDLRFTQIVSCIQLELQTDDMFYIEDDKIEDALSKMIDNC